MEPARSHSQRLPAVVVHDVAILDEYVERIRTFAAKSLQFLAEQGSANPLKVLRLMKFEKIGFHPVWGYPLNLIEQLNQSWTYAVALAATRKLFELHPDAGGFNVAPGAHMAIPLDIMSLKPNLVGAEIFAAVDPRNNRKLQNDIAKLASRHELNRYVFFSSPRYPQFQRHENHERSGVQVWSVKITDE